MSLFSERALVDGRPTHQILAIEKRHDGMTIVVGPRRVSHLALLAGLGIVLFNSFLLLLLTFLAVSTPVASPFAARVTGVLVCIVWFAVLACVLLMQLRRRINHRTISIEEGLLTLSSGPLGPSCKTLQLRGGDGFVASERPGNARRWVWPSSQGEAIREYGIHVSHGKNCDRDVEIIPPFTLSHYEASKLAAQMQKYAVPVVEQSVLGSRY